MSRALVNVPKRARPGQVIEIKTLISHIMETGYRRNEVGAMVPRDIINAFVCTYNGEEVFRAVGNADPATMSLLIGLAPAQCDCQAVAAEIEIRHVETD